MPRAHFEKKQPRVFFFFSWDPLVPDEPLFRSHFPHHDSRNGPMTQNVPIHRDIQQFLSHLKCLRFLLSANIKWSSCTSRHILWGFGVRPVLLVIPDEIFAVMSVLHTRRAAWFCAALEFNSTLAISKYDKTIPCPSYPLPSHPQHNACPISLLFQ